MEEKSDARLGRDDFDRGRRGPVVPAVARDPVGRGGGSRDIPADLAVESVDCSGNRVGESMRHARSVLANQVPVEEVDAVEVSQKIAFEERADRLADALAGNLDHVRAVIARLALNSERQRLAGGRIALIVYRSDERHRRAGADI